MSIRNKSITSIALLMLGFLLVVLLFQNKVLAASTGSIKGVALALVSILGFVSARTSYQISKSLQGVNKASHLVLMTLGIALGSIFLAGLILYYGFRDFGF